MWMVRQCFQQFGRIANQVARIRGTRRIELHASIEPLPRHAGEDHQDSRPPPPAMDSNGNSGRIRLCQRVAQNDQIERFVLQYLQGLRCIAADDIRIGLRQYRGPCCQQSKVLSCQKDFVHGTPAKRRKFEFFNLGRVHNMKQEEPRGTASYHSNRKVIILLIDETP